MRHSPVMTMMIRAAEKAGRAIVRDFGEVEHLQASRKGPRDFVTVADEKAERIVREELTRARPRYGLLMEESGETVGADTSHRFIVDPIDGTTNFMHGVPYFAVSIALEESGEIIAGVVFNPITDELFWAERNQGAYLHDRRLRVSGRANLGDGLLAAPPYVPAAHDFDVWRRLTERLARPTCVSMARRRSTWRISPPAGSTAMWRPGLSRGISPRAPSSSRKRAARSAISPAAGVGSTPAKSSPDRRRCIVSCSKSSPPIERSRRSGGRSSNVVESRRVR